MAIPNESETPTAVQPEAPLASLAHGAEQAVDSAGATRWVDDLSVAAGDRLMSAADALRQRRFGAGVWGPLADRLEDTAVYLQEEKLAGLAEELTGVVRRYPVQTLVAGAAIGFLLGRIRRD